MDNKPKKMTYALGLPYGEPTWSGYTLASFHYPELTFGRPSLSTEHEAAILSLLIPLLQPVGAFRRSHVPRSKGKGRAGKPPNPSAQDPISPPASMPEIYNNLTIGFNTTIRRLEALSQVRKPSSLSEPKTAHQSDPAPTNLVAVLVCRRSLPQVMTSSIPLLIAAAAPKSSRSRLIEISTQSESKLAQALGQPRVGVLGVENDAAGATALARFVVDNIGSVDIPWLEPLSSPIYLPVKIHSATTAPKEKSSGDARKRKKSEKT
ncbi:uncharacterized protein A1O9_01487 [Exophiala aquamarina CBS 119918]|uniref:Uncharacterized protein n=1 Tax=Exophiala aquamarina CBS 119918 TaxID=1182545 RepID=A0A072PTS6_9EURO|nr:uncharacterized protein A1O9_01487 [Exophiala aquamarina CBS 119918]KEF63509.1 hypothetical protein A1O9_01487 [Exophiala aquamarina CBS 119918]